MFIAGCSAVDLDELREIHAVTEGCLDSSLVRMLTAAGEGAIFAGPVWATARMFNGGEESGQS